MKILKEEQRVCPICKNGVENEIHVLFYCPLYEHIRIDMVNKANNMNSNFKDVTDQDKLNYVLSSEHMLKTSSKICYMILQARTDFLYR